MAELSRSFRALRPWGCLPGRLGASLAALSLSACAVIDEERALQARSVLIGMPALEAQTCLGLPDQRLSVGSTTLLTYFANSPRSVSLSLPVGIGVNYSGYCHVTVRIERGRVTRVVYSGDTDTILGRDAACGPVVRACLGSERP